MLLEILDYCIENRDYKEASEGGRTKKLVEKFFDNVENFMKKQGFTKGADKLRYFYYGDNAAVNISDLYAYLFNRNIWFAKERKKTKIMVEEFEAKLRGSIKTKEWKSNYERVSLYLVTQNAQNAKKNLEILAINISHAFVVDNERLLEGDIQWLSKYYKDILEIYQRNPEEILPDELLDEYKDIMKEMQNINRNYVGLNKES